MSVRNLRVAIAGMGRSGQAIARACVEHGAEATVYDETTAETPDRLAIVDHLQGLGAQVVAGWHGRLDPADFDLLVASPGFRREHAAIRDALAGGREVISEVEFAYRIAKSPIVAITGTNGKSTTTVLTWLVLGGALGQGRRAILCGNLSGSGYPELTLTEAALDGSPQDILVAEVSSYQLEWVRDFRPRAAAITNVTPDHLDRHPTFEDYLQTKLRIFARMGAGDVAVANESEPSLPIERLLAAMAPEVGLRTFVADGARHTYSKGQFSSPTTYRDGDHLVLGGRSVAISDLPLTAEHDLTNAMMAWELALAAAPDGAFEPMLRGLLGFRGLENRMERLGERGGVLVVNNSMCTNPAAVVSSSRGLRMPQHLLMGGHTKNLDFTPVRDYLATSGHRAYLFGGTETDPLDAQLGGAWPRFASLDEAFAAACASAKAGEAILLAPGCMSASPFPSFRERGAHFRALARAWFES